MDTVDTVDMMDTEDMVDTVDTVDAVDMIDAVDTVDMVDTPGYSGCQELSDFQWTEICTSFLMSLSTENYFLSKIVVWKNYKNECILSIAPKEESLCKNIVDLWQKSFL